MGRGNMQGPGMGMMGNGMGGGLGFDAYGQLGMMANGDGGLPAPLPQTPPPGSSMAESMGSPVGSGVSLGKRVVVLNLPWQTTWQALKEFFTAAGTITRADVAVDETGRSR